uniref:Uncharacterized protein n=1 Tax=Triticum urartu TaxID=4572 RepID=A0A8R7UJA4_TRIUA
MLLGWGRATGAWWPENEQMKPTPCLLRYLGWHANADDILSTEGAYSFGILKIQVSLTGHPNYMKRRKGEGKNTQHTPGERGRAEW